MVDAATRRAFTSLVAAACIDGRVAEEERRYLMRKAGEFGIAQPEAEGFIRQGTEGRFTVSIPPTPAGKEALMGELIDLACVDGRVEAQEKQLLTRFASHIGLDAGDLGNRVRERMNRGRNSPAAREPKQPSRVEPPAPIKLDTPPPPALPESPNLLALSPGPVKLSGPTSPGAGDLSPITRELVKSVIRFDGREEAVEYLLRSCGFADANDARRVVDRIIADEPDCAAGSQKVRRGRPG
jgi:uncharacterized tellurite resistance protein B-like protein